MGITIQPLGRHHERTAFTCGQADLDEWFRHRASQDQKRRIARVFVAVDDELGVVGFYSLSSFIVTATDLPPEIVRKLPRYVGMPAALIGRLARDERVRGHGVGELLLADALCRVVDVAESMAVFAIVVDAKDDRAAEFYEAFGFRKFPSRANRLFLPVSTVLDGVNKARRPLSGSG